VGDHGRVSVSATDTENDKSARSADCTRGEMKKLRMCNLHKATRDSTRNRSNRLYDNFDDVTRLVADRMYSKLDRSDKG
jgi:hypothetical protein